MHLQHATWLEVEAYLKHQTGIIIPTGSTEQHGPMGLIGTDALCAELIATGAADKTDTLLAPTLAYTPAPFNMAFPGSISISAALFTAMLNEITDGLAQQGFRHIYFLNGHGANLDPLRQCAQEQVMKTPELKIKVRSWWDFEVVNVLREQYYGDWEGMHALSLIHI